MSFHYTLYGLGIASDFCLPELVASLDSAVDVVIRRGSIEGQPFDATTGGRQLYVTAAGVHLSWERLGAFLVRNGNEIIVSPHPEGDEDTIRLPLLGIVFAVLLHQRGYLALHGSVVTSSGEAFAFLGHKGHGKSTLAAALRRQGYGFLSDDTVALDLQGSDLPVVLPAFPRQKLWPDALAALGENPEELGRISSTLEKRHYPVTDSYVLGKVPLKAIYLLGGGDKLEILPLTAQEAMIRLLPHLSLAPFGNQFLQVNDTSHFAQCATIARQVPLYRLKRPAALELLSDTVQMIKAHTPIKFEPEIMKSPNG